MYHSIGRTAAGRAREDSSSRGSRCVRAVVTGVLAALFAVSAIGAQASAASETAGASGSGPRLTLQGPTSAGVNEPFTVKLIARGVKNVAGYEATLRFDPKALVFGGAEQRGLGLASTGRGVESLGPVERSDGVVIGAWSCARPDCVTRAGRLAPNGPSGDVLLARLSFTALKAGHISLSVGRVKIVNSAGVSVKASASGASLQLASRRIARAATTSRTFAEPALASDGALSTGLATSGHGRSRDLNRDGLVTHADVMDAAITWMRARESSAVCGNAAGQSDVTGDGCVDIRDIQRIASALAGHGAKRPRGSSSGTTIATIPGGGPIVVNSNGDAADAVPGDGVCLTAGGDCTLRAAIVEANMAVGPDEIDFAIPGGGVQTITLGGPLPTISDETGPTIVDGYTQAGATVNSAPLASNAQLKVQITGNTSIDAVTISSAGNVIRGLALFGLHRPIWLTGAGAQLNKVTGSFVGENAAGSYIPPSFINMANGFSVTLGASYNQLGEATLAGRNVISGNAHNGIWFWDEGTDRNVVVNSIIGLSPDGLSQRWNVGRGIDINAMTSFTTVGGTGSLERNVIGGNLGEGIEFSHNRLTNENRAVNNFIGTDLTGEASPAYASNYWAGIHFEDGVTENLAIGNTIANSGCGNASGNIALETKADGNVIKGNFIGISRGGAALASCYWGITVRAGAMRTQIGPDNDIANNPIGVRIDGPDTDQNTITRNSIHNNANLGIDLSPEGITPNDAGDADSGPNENLNVPVISLASTSAVTGSACASCRVEIFRTQAAPGAAGQGREFMLAGNADAGGSFNIGVPGLAAGDVVTATATDGPGNTSEFATNTSVVNGGGSAVVVAADAFERSVTNGWGAADTGGNWTQAFGTAADYGVAGGAGTMRFTGATQNRGQLLNGASALDVDFSVQVSVNKPAAGGTQYVYAALRRQGTDEYRAKLRFDTLGRVSLNASRVIGTTEQDIGTYVNLPISQTTPIQLRTLVTGSNPTTLRVKAWAVGAAEPVDWQLVVTDASPSLQAAGALGLRGYVGGGTSNAPIIYSFDALSASTPGTGGPPPPPPPPPDPTDYATDAFSRVVTDAWGKADWGGTWAVSTNVPDYDVDGGRATMFLSAGGISRGAYLAGVSAADVDLSFRFSADSAATGNGTFAYGAARRVGGGTEYRIKVRISPTGGVYLQATRVVRNTEVGLGVEAKVPSLTYVPGTDIMVRARITGTSPTTLTARAWSGTGTEPATWQYTTTDSTAVLQAPGGVGLRGYISSSATRAVLLSFDNFRVIAP
ncbi:MAG: hypothetical protein QOH61_1757 [Chloroflexota bacterium]|nr:hypothetical protein [Chloroflexota bacterium]